MAKHRTRISVVRGGPSTEYQVSLRTGETVLKHLDREKYDVNDVVLTRDGVWYINGVRANFAQIAERTDVVFNAMHGEFGEDGKAQQLFNAFGLPHTGSDSVASAVGMHKALAKDHFKRAGIPVARGEVIPRDANMPGVAFHIARDFGLPVVVKPVTGGSSIATSIARDETQLILALDEAAKHADVLVEEFLDGKEATCAVIDSGDGEHFVLIPTEIRHKNEGGIFDHESKYSGCTEEVCPGNFTIADMSKIRELASAAHRAIGARHYSRSDFIVTPNGVYILEINTLPGLTEQSLLPLALGVSGVTMPEFLDHIIDLAKKG